MVGINVNAQQRMSYCTRYNNFAQLSYRSENVIVGDFLQHDNTTTQEALVLDSTLIDSYSNYKYYLHFANLHNKEGKTYKVTDKHGKSRNVAPSSCGIVIGYTNQGYWLVTVKCSNTALYNESVDKRSMTVTLMRCDNGKCREVDSFTTSADVDLNDGYNYLCAQVDDKFIKISLGKDKLKKVINHVMDAAEQRLNEGFETVKVGYYVAPGAMISIERAVLSQGEASSTSAPLYTHWTREALDRHFEQSKNPFEGYWTYLDRDMEDSWLKLGGRYTVALVETEQGYDVIYIEGAQVKKSLWQLGMKKGEMHKTIFTDNFSGKWIDATFEPIDEDVYVTFESGVILNFKFPVYKSQVRFSKVLDAGL